MLVVNCLFRLGGACALMSNHPADAKVAKYQLTHTVRTHLGAQDDAFGCMGNGEDADGVMGKRRRFLVFWVLFFFLSFER